MGSLPQWLVLPSAGEAHHGGLYGGIFGKKRLEVLNEGVPWIDAVEPVGNAAELRFKNKPPLFQYVNLFSEGDGLFCIFHIKRNVPPWSAGLATRSVVGFVAAKIVLLFDTAKHFEGEFYYSVKKGCKRSEISS